MAEESSFADLIRRVRAGDSDAATQLVRDYEPAIRRSLRLRLDPRLRRTCDSMDICQAVMCSFFIRAASGQYELDTPEQLMKLLATMARNKLVKTRRDQFRARRDARRVEAGSTDDRDVAGKASTPSQQIEAKDLLSEVHRRLTDEERHLVEQRNQGREWADIAAEVGGSPEALRKKLARAVDRVADELGIDEADHE
ncbi:MAG: sigma-70 family RNA polymerase sigma factor [Planctomycetes bacterium]|nr:sigma-70 family RNA polymerase sigma factor [Planctomycetota bacterium]